MEKLQWEDYYHHKYNMPYREADITDLIDSNQDGDIISVTIRKYPRRYTVACEWWAGEDYTCDGDGDGVIPVGVTSIVFRAEHHAVESDWLGTLRILRQQCQR